MYVKSNINCICRSADRSIDTITVGLVNFMSYNPVSISIAPIDTFKYLTDLYIKFK